MRYRLVMYQTDRRWLELPAGQDQHPDFGLEIPEGGRVHSVVPATTVRRSGPYGAQDEEAVTQWAVFIAVPLPRDLEAAQAATAQVRAKL